MIPFGLYTHKYIIGWPWVNGIFVVTTGTIIGLSFAGELTEKRTRIDISFG
jgi:hypothetical protein